VEVANNKQEFWKKHRLAYELQDLSIVKYCKRENLNTYTFKYYREKYLKEQRIKDSNIGMETASRFVRVQPCSASNVVMKNSSVASASAKTETVLAQLIIGDGIRLECLSWPEPSWLLRLNRGVSGD
jgi:hypothetical protein